MMLYTERENGIEGSTYLLVMIEYFSVHEERTREKEKKTSAVQLTRDISKNSQTPFRYTLRFDHWWPRADVSDYSTCSFKLGWRGMLSLYYPMDLLLRQPMRSNDPCLVWNLRKYWPLCRGHNHVKVAKRQNFKMWWRRYAKVMMRWHECKYFSS